MTNENKILVNIVSFGYKYGVPEDSDLVYNVRFLPNPYYIPEMKSRTGFDSDVYDYVMNFDETKQFFKKLKETSEYLIPLYEKAGMEKVKISVGCTGGRHRSVTIVRALSDVLEKAGYNVTVCHRDIQKIG